MREPGGGSHPVPLYYSMFLYILGRFELALGAGRAGCQECGAGSGAKQVPSFPILSAWDVHQGQITPFLTTTRKGVTEDGRN